MLDASGSLHLQESQTRGNALRLGLDVEPDFAHSKGKPAAELCSHLDIRREVLARTRRIVAIEHVGSLILQADHAPARARQIAHLVRASNEGDSEVLAQAGNRLDDVRLIGNLLRSAYDHVVGVRIARLKRAVLIPPHFEHAFHEHAKLRGFFQPERNIARRPII